MNDEFIYITAQQMLGYGTSRIADIKRYFGSAQKFIESPVHEILSSGIFTKSELNRITSYKLETTDLIIKRCHKIGCEIVHLKHKNYPKALKYISAPPIVLYTFGDLSFLQNKLAISIVGARDIGEYADKITKILSEQLATAGAVIVSGGAVGVDSAAHKSALQAGCKTIGIIPCGLDYNYLVENADLRTNIVKNGAIFSEFAPGHSITRSGFHIRNRLISGISQGTVIVQAGERSGSLITARHALDQGRDVFVVPGSILDSNFSGSNSLLRDGAKLVTGTLDILEDYLSQYFDTLDMSKIKSNFTDEQTIPTEIGSNIPAKKSNKKNKIQPQEIIPENSPVNNVNVEEILSRLSENSKIVYNKLKEEAFNIDELVVVCGIHITDLHPALYGLEMEDLIVASMGNMYRLK